MLTDKARSAISKLPSSRRSEATLRADAKASSRTFSNAWVAARRATLYIKKPQVIGSGRNKRLKTTIDKNGKTRTASIRTKMAGGKHAYKMLVSAAAAEVADVVAGECEQLRGESGGELKHAPLLPNLTDAARHVLDQALIAYAQTHFSAAVAIKDRVGMHSKVSEGCMHAACQVVDQRIATSASFNVGSLPVGASVPVSKPKKKGKKSDKEHGDASKGQAEPAKDA